MLDRLHNYIVAVVAAALTLVALIGVGLSLTVWKPSQEVISTTTAEHHLVMTREGVLPLFAEEVLISVKAGGADQVAIIRGATPDVKGWIGDSAFTEVVGVASSMDVLLVEQHSGLPSNAGSDSPQSGDSSQSPDRNQSASQSQSAAQPQSAAQAQSAAQPQSASQPQSADTRQSADTLQSAANGTTLPEVLAKNDMWTNVATGVGEVHLRITDTKGPVAILAASSGENPTITLSWPVQQRNVMLLLSGVLAALFGAVTVFTFLRQYMLERSRVTRAETLEARRTADVTETATLSVEEIAAYGKEQEDAAKKDADSQSDETSTPEEKRSEDKGPEDKESEDQILEDEAHTHSDASIAFLKEAASRDKAASVQDELDAAQEEIARVEHTHSDAYFALINESAHSTESAGPADTPASTQNADVPPAQADDTDDKGKTSEAGGQPLPEKSADTDVQHGAAPNTRAPEAAAPEQHEGQDSHTEQTSEAAPSAPDHDDHTLTPADDAPAGSPAQSTETAEESQRKAAPASPQPVGRHGGVRGQAEPHHEEAVSTDTGTIDLTAIRPGAILPSRRALREARARGESEVTIDGHSFDTGLIPRITRVDAQEIESLTASGHEQRAKVEEYIYDDGESSSPQAKAPSQGEWRSMMSSWVRERKNEEGAE